MKDQLLYMLACGRLIQDSATNIYTYIDVFDTIFLNPPDPKNPKEQVTTYQTFWVIGRIYIHEKETFKGNIKIIDPNGETFNESPLLGEVEPGILNVTGYFNLAPFVIPGRYKLELYKDGKKMKDNDNYYFDVVQQQ